MSRPENATAIVTASDSGIGRATAVALARDGYDVGITFHSDEQGAQEAAEEVRALGRRAVVRRLDLAHDLPQAAARHPVTVAGVGSAGPVATFLRVAAEAVERVVGGAPSVRRRLERASLDLTVHEFRVQQVVWGLLGFAVAAAWSLLRSFAHGGSGVAVTWPAA